MKYQKKSGGGRRIAQPSKKLKGIQAWVLNNILDKLKVSDSSKGFEKGTSIVNNVIPHLESTSILNLDLEDFFDNVKSEQVYTIFKSIGYNTHISTIFTNICTYDDALPQGGSCSPKLANLALWKLDVRIQGYVGKKGITYTRYADDLTFSGLNPSTIGKIEPFIKKIIEDENFKINRKKTRLVGSSRAKIVTGLVINGNKFGIGKKKYRILRSKIHHLSLPANNKNFNLFNEVRGWLAYLKNVDNIRFKRTKKYIEKLQKENPNSILKDL